MDVRKVAFDWHGLRLILEGIKDTLASTTLKIDSVGGSSIGVASIVGGMIFDHPFIKSGFWIRDNLKGHGTNKLIEGTMTPYPLLLEDVVTTGDSVRRCIEVMPYKPAAILSIVTRNQNTDFGIPFYSLLTLEDLL